LAVGSRIIVASVAGSAAGILGVTGLGGFIFYAAASALVSLLVLHRTGYNTSKYFTSPSALWTEAVGQGLLVPPAPRSLRLPTTTCSLAPFFSLLCLLFPAQSYVLFWTYAAPSLLCLSCDSC
jgi:hypothetical protein